VGAILRGFKGSVTRQIGALRDAPDSPIWQRNYYERIIRNEREHDALAEYILNNPAQWAADRENPAVA
jgi:REP element-mobilizing transposase RayT